MNNLSKILMLSIIAVFLMAGSAMAAPVSLGEILSNPLYDSITDTGAGAVTLTDTDGYEDDATAFLLLELAGYAGTNTFGIYGYSYDALGKPQLGSTLEIFQGSDSPDVLTGNQTLYFNVASSLVSLNSDMSNPVSIGINFGFYISTQDNHTFYSQSALNKDGIDHMLIFDTSSIGSGLSGSDVVIAIEDLYGGGDGDYNDMVVGVTDVAPIPEPATMLLFGTGLICFAVIGRRRFIK